MAGAKQGDTIKVHYTGKLDDGTVFDSSESRDPLEFTIGSGQLIPGFDKAVLGMNLGETITTHIPENDAYGARREDLVFKVERQLLPKDIEPTVGQQLSVKDKDNHNFEVTIIEIKDNVVLLDSNHPLAGKELIFEITLIEIALSVSLRGLCT